MCGETVRFTAIVTGLNRRKPIPTGTVTFLIDGEEAGKPAKLNRRGQAQFRLKNTARIRAGAHMIRAVYNPDGNDSPYRTSTSPILVHTRRNEGYPEPDGHPHDGGHGGGPTPPPHTPHTPHGIRRRS